MDAYKAAYVIDNLALDDATGIPIGIRMRNENFSPSSCVLSTLILSHEVVLILVHSRLKSLALSCVSFESSNLWPPRTHQGSDANI